MRPIMSGWRLLVLSAGIRIAGGGSALACGGGKLLFEDKFETLDPLGVLTSMCRPIKWPRRLGI